MEDFANELKKIAPDTLQAEDLLPRLQALIKEYSETVTKYARKSNFVKRVMRGQKFAEEIKVYNERLDNMIAMISVNQTVTLVEWRTQYEQDTVNMISELTDMRMLQQKIWMAIKELRTQIEDTVLLVKREMRDVSDDFDQEATSQPLDPVLRSIVNIAEQKFLKGKVVKDPFT